MIRISKCNSCKNILENDDPESKLYRCKAFPEEIPDEIVKNKISHDFPYHGDNGYRYERDEDYFT